MRIAICEDDVRQQESIKSLLDRLEVSEELSVDCYTKGESLIDNFVLHQRYDIVLMDMQLPGMDGIETARLIRFFDTGCIIIIITSILEYAIEGYGVDAYDFILKPIDEGRFNRTLEKAINHWQKKKQKIYQISQKGRGITLQLDQIIYIESFGRKVLVHCLKGTYENNSCISDEEEVLKEDGFLRVSRYYLVNMKHIKEILAREIRLSGNAFVSINPKRRKEIYDVYTEYAMEVME